jgi:succinoglycan biosynthesis protein ExoA
VGVRAAADAGSRRVARALATRLGTATSTRWSTGLDQRREVEVHTSVFTGIWRRATLERYHGWDEGWPVNQDSELAARMHRQGARIVSLPELAADYVPRASLRALSRQYRRYGMYRAKTALQHPATLRARHVALPALVATIAAALAGPPRVRRHGRRVVGAYALVLFAQGAALASEPADLVRMPAVFATMHASWGAGFLIGLVWFSPPSRRSPVLATIAPDHAPAG